MPSISTWAVYSCARPSERLRHGGSWGPPAWIQEGGGPQPFVTGLALEAEGPPVSAAGGDGGGKALLHRLWKQQGRLSPSQAADAAFFLALRKNPPQALLQQLIAFVLHKNPGRCLSSLRIHSSLQKRMQRMHLPELQLLLADLASIYSPLFLPLFTEAAKQIKKKCRAADTNTDNALATAAPAAAAAGAEGMTPLHAAFLLHAYGRTDCRDSDLFDLCLSRVTSAARQLLHAQRALSTSQQGPPPPSSTGGPLQIPPTCSIPMGPPTRSPYPSRCCFPEESQQASFVQPYGEGVGEEKTKLFGEALVMCLRGLANAEHKTVDEERHIFLELLVPYLLDQQPSVLGSPPPSRRLSLLFGALSAFTRLGVGPLQVSRLMEAACSQPSETLGPYEACDLLTAALAIQPAAIAAADENASAALAASLPEASAFSSATSSLSAAKTPSAAVAKASTSSAARQASSEASAKAERGSVDAAFPPPRNQRQRGSLMRSPVKSEVSWLMSSLDYSADNVGGSLEMSSSNDERKTSLFFSPPSFSLFQDAMHSYTCSVGLGMEALRLSLFRMHPTFRVSVLSTLTSLKAVLPNPAKPRKPFLISLPAYPKHTHHHHHQQQQQQEQQQEQQQQRMHAPASFQWPLTIPTAHTPPAAAAAAAARGASTTAAPTVASATGPSAGGAAEGATGAATEEATDTATEAAGNYVFQASNRVGPKEKKKENDDMCRPSINTLIIPSPSTHSGAACNRIHSPLHPVLRRVLLSVFYRLPCVSLRLLVELLQALHACEYSKREEEGEQLSPHGKSARWHRPLLAALAREGVRRMHEGREESVLRFLFLFYEELDGWKISLDPLVFACNRLSRASSFEALKKQPEVLSAFRGILVEADKKPEAAHAWNRLTPQGARLVDETLSHA
ncbi:hypothetical protein ACSSS7_001082 [Eimeria intestinalis]